MFRPYKEHAIRKGSLPGAMFLKALWKGSISFGLVNIPVQLYPATKKKEVKFNYLHARCLTPINYQKRCPTCDQAVASEEIVWGYQYEKGKYVIFKEEDFEQLPQVIKKTIEIIDFVPAREIDPIFFEKSYYVEPQTGGQKAYTLLLKAMEKTQKVAIAKVVLRTKENLAALRVRDNYLLLETMFYADEIRSPQELNLPATGVNPEEREMTMAITLVENLTAPFQPEKYENTYQAVLRELIETKITREEVKVPPRPETGRVVDLMEALRASIKMAEETRRGDTKTRKKKAARQKA